MKNKPTRHKETNTFKFKPFSERISDIDVDVFHRVAHRNENDSDDAETHFYQSLQKWNVLNLTESYCSFKKEVHGIITLPQLLNSKQHVTETLLNYLKRRDTLCLQPILESVVAVARDLQKEFYEYFPEFLESIIELLETKDTEQLEYTFTTLAYLFKFLWRYLIKNVNRVFDLLVPLLADSKPIYVNNFAAESFAFVVRKIKDKAAFLKLVLQVLKEKPEGLPGCGRLLFEVVRGTPGQFHSCAEQMFTLYLGALLNETGDRVLLGNVLERIIDNLLNAVHPRYAQVFWDVSFRLMDCFIKKYDEERNPNDDKSEIKTEVTGFCLLLKLLLRVVVHKEGRMLVNPIPLVKKLVHIIGSFDRCNKDVLETSTKLSAAILLASNIELTQESSSQLIMKILSIRDDEILHAIVEELVPHSSFETLVLPQLLQRSFSSGLDSAALRLFAKIVNDKAAPCLGGVHLEKWSKYSLDFRGIAANDITYLMKELGTLTEENISDNVFRILIILPHMSPILDECRIKLLDFIRSTHNRLLLNINGTREGIDELCFSFLLAVEAACHILDPNDFYHYISSSNIDLSELIRNYRDSTSILNTVDLCLSYIAASDFSHNFINKEMFESLNASLVPLLGSPFHKVRLSVAHMYSLFGNVKELTLSDEHDGKLRAFELPYAAETEPATVHKYRDKLLHLQALTFDGHAVVNMDPKYYEFPLHYLLGNLYINFSLLWDSTIKLIATYAHKQCPQFWPIFLSKLEDTTMMVVSSHTSTFQCDVIRSLQAKVFDFSEDKPDHKNYKLLLWKCMAEFPDFCETKNRDLTGIFIDSVDRLFFKSNSEDAISCNIEKHAPGTACYPDHVMQEEETNEEKDVSKAGGKSELDGKYKLKLLLAQMEVFARMKNPKTLYREADVQKIYLELLSSKNAQVQKAALNCLITYKHKYLSPYKEHLYNLIDEKSLKNELALFRIDKESNMIQDEHREGLIPILMRIIYAKMVMRTGMRTGGKAGGLARRTIILRFLMGGQEEEMMIFIKMAFKLFEKYVPFSPEREIDLNEMTRMVIVNTELSNVIPPRRLQSSVNLLAIMIEQFGAKMTNKLLPRLLGLLICILAQVTGISKKSESVHSGYLSSIRNLRTSCIGILARFFAHYENYGWITSEIDALFNVAVFPWLEKLPIEGIHSPTALLKMFIAWSQNPRYYPFFVKHQENEPSMTPLPCVMRLLVGPKTHSSVINAIMEMIEKMLTLQDYGTTNQDEDATHEVEAKGAPLYSVVTNTLVQGGIAGQQTSSIGVCINYGSAILLPHVPTILEYMRGKLKTSQRGVNRVELTVLSRVSEMVTDGETCDTLLNLLLPILVKKASTGASEETVVELVTTILNLIKNVEEPEKHIRLIVPLVGIIEAVSARKLLMRLYDVIAEGSDEKHRDTMMQNSELLKELNAWDRKWIDQPDFERRLDAFNRINIAIEKDTITLDIGVAIIYNCFFFLKNEKDLALRDCSGQCVLSIGPKLAKMCKENNSNRRYLIEDTILSIVRSGIRDKNEVVKYQSIALLGRMASECSDVHPVFRDLFMLVNEADPEVDFFENLQHLQLHRKARALLKFCSVAKTLTKPPNPKTLTQFILPLASSYLCNEVFVNKNSIIDAAIETVGTVCRLLPWHQYEIILKYYLDKLRSLVEFQKQTVRVVVAILDSFHYDLSKYTDMIGGIPNSIQQEDENLTAIINDKNDVAGDDKTDTTAANMLQEADEKLDQALDTLDAASSDEQRGKVVEETQEDIPVMQKQIVLSQSAARRLVSSISKGLLPQLHRAIMARTQHENSHKINRRKTGMEREDEELLRVPIAFAIVKLLQKLPGDVLEQNLTGVLMKLCSFLKSRLDSVRRVARETLQKIMITLGPDYLHHLLSEMNNLLTKGFQVHVLVYTVHAILTSLKPYYKPLHINRNLQSILTVCKVDLFGLSAEEKEIAGIVRTVSEAKSTKSFDIFHILAQFITESCLLDLILPLKDALVKTHSYKVIRKVVECLRQVVLGLADNTFVQTQQMLKFLYGVVSESIPELLPLDKTKSSSEKKRAEQTMAQRRPADCFIVAPEPKNRMGIRAMAKTSSNTNAHVLVEFGLKLYHILLKRERISGSEYESYLDPVVPILNDCLKAQHIKLSTLALQCLNWILKMDLPSLKMLVPEICSSMFNILHKYAAAGLSKGDNFDLVMAAFKCMAVLVRDVKHFTIGLEQLKILIVYAEQDLHDCDKQATAFTLLKAILSRKLIVPEIHQLMEKVAMLSVTSELDHVRQQSRSVFYMFLMEYPLGNTLEKHLSFYLTQLGYELQSGRQSALEMIHGIVTGFPITVLSQHSGLLFLMVGARLVNDDDPVCRKLSAKCIKEMISRLPHNDKNKLFDIVLLWLKDSKVSHRRLAAQLCGIFVLVEKDCFESRLLELLPLILKQFRGDNSDESEPGRFVKAYRLEEDRSVIGKTNCNDSPERIKDHHLFQVLQMLLKISSNCSGFLKNEQYQDTVCTLAEYSQTLLAHPHLWVRLAAAQFIGFILAALDIERVTAVLLERADHSYESDTTDVRSYIYRDPINTIKSLALDLAAQLQPNMEFEALAEQVVKNLVFIARVIAVNSVGTENRNDLVKEEEHPVKMDGAGRSTVSLLWLVKRMRNVVNIEVTQAPKSESMRTAVFKWVAGIVATVPMKFLDPVLFHILSPLVREMSTTEDSNAPLRRLAKEVATMIKKKLGSEQYARLLSKVQQRLDTRRAERKRIRTQELVTDPELAAKRKIAKQQKKKEAKKRKLDVVRGRPKERKRPKKEIDLDT